VIIDMGATESLAVPQCGCTKLPRQDEVVIQAPRFADFSSIVLDRGAVGGPSARLNKTHEQSNDLNESYMSEATISTDYASSAESICTTASITSASPNSRPSFQGSIQPSAQPLDFHFPSFPKQKSLQQQNDPGISRSLRERRCMKPLAVDTKNVRNSFNSRRNAVRQKLVWPTECGPNTSAKPHDNRLGSTSTRHARWSWQVRHRWSQGSKTKAALRTALARFDSSERDHPAKQWKFSLSRAFAKKAASP